MKRTKTEKGITLVALILTIVVLLILSLVVINSITNDRLVSQVENTTNKYNASVNQEQGTLGNYTNSFEGLMMTEITIEKAKSNEMLKSKVHSIISDINGKKIVIPKGFKLLINSTTGYTSAEDIAVNKGIVITDGKNEFVWIPVENLNEFARETSGTDANGRKNYQGVLYNFPSYYYREPANTTLDDASKFTSITLTESFYQESFNAMVESVKTYGGFYVGRYETSIGLGNVAQSKSGETPMNNMNWWQMYENSLTYSKSDKNLGVVSEMIWGCQWDAMLKLILTGEDASHVTSSSNVSHSLTSPYKTGGTNYTGSVQYKDKASNIYDLEGNVFEATQCRTDIDYEFKGGNFSEPFSPDRGGHVLSELDWQRNWYEIIIIHRCVN